MASRPCTLQDVQAFEQFIADSRSRFLRTDRSRLTFTDAFALAEDLAQRVTYYRQIHGFRRQLKDGARSGGPGGARAFDFALSVRSGGETREYDFVDRQASELLIVLQRMQDEVE